MELACHVLESAVFSCTVKSMAWSCEKSNDIHAVSNTVSWRWRFKSLARTV